MTMNTLYDHIQGRRHGFLSGGVGFLVFTRWVGVFFFATLPSFVRAYVCVCVCNKSARSAAKFGITY